MVSDTYSSISNIVSDTIEHIVSDNIEEMRDSA